MNINKFFIVSRYLFTALNFVAILAITSLIDTADFGRLSFFRLVIQYLMYSEFGFVQYVFRKRSAEERIMDWELSSIISYLGISVGSFFLIFSILNIKYNVFFSSQIYVLYAFFSVIFGIVSKFVIDQLRVTGEINKLIGLEFITNAIVYGIVFFSWMTHDHNVDTFVSMYALYMAPYLVFALFSPLVRRKLKNIRFRVRFERNIFYGSSMLFLFGFLSLIFSSVNRVILKYFVSYKALGLYSMAFTVSSGFYLIIQTIMWINMPHFIKKIKKESVAKSREEFKHYIQKIQLIYFSVTILACPCYYFLIQYYNPAYKGTLYIFLLLFVYNYIGILYIYHRTYLLTFEHYQELNLTLLLAIVCNFGLNLCLLRFNSLEVLVAGSIFSHLVYMMLVRRTVAKRVNLACSI